MTEAKRQLGDTIEYAIDPYDTVENADCLVLVIEWNEFRFPDWIRIKSLLKKPVIFDGRNVYDVNEMKGLGFDYICIGINTLKSK